MTENTVYFLPNNDAEQAQIHLYIPMQKTDKKDDVLRSAFNQYFGLDFTGIVLNESAKNAPWPIQPTHSSARKA